MGMVGENRRCINSDEERIYLYNVGKREVSFGTQGISI
jgi:hypothetical protein